MNNVPNILAKAAYLAYRASIGAAQGGHDLPAWDDLFEHEKSAWRDAAHAARAVSL